MANTENASVWYSFTNKHDVEINYLFDYVPVRDKTKDDAGSELTLALKDEEYAQEHNVDQGYVIQAFEAYISRDLVDPFPSRIVVTVPSSDPKNFHRAIDKVAKKVNERHSNPAGRPYLKRMYEVKKSHLSNNRDPMIHEKSIEVPYPGWVRGRHFLLIDDVTTTGSSMDVCRNKLLHAGARSVTCAVFAKTFDDYNESKSSNDFQIRRSRANIFLDKAKHGRGGRVSGARYKATNSGSVSGRLLEIRKVGGKSVAFFSSYKSMEVPDGWVEYLEGFLQEELTIGYSNITRGGEDVRVFYADTDFIKSVKREDYIRHDEFGAGKVFEVKSGSIRIDFPKVGMRELWLPAHRITPSTEIEFLKSRYESGDIKHSAFALAKLLHKSNPSESKRYETAAVNAGDIDAVLEVANRYRENGQADDALSLYQKAFDLGERFTSAFQLALHWHDRDPEKAIYYYKLSYEAGDRFASTNNMANLIKADDPQEAIRLFDIAVKNGNNYYAPFNYAELIVDQDRDKAIELYGIASKNGHLDASLKLSRLLEDIDTGRAIKEYEHAYSLKKDPRILFNMGWLYERSDRSKAMDMYKEAIKAGAVKDAANNLAVMIQESNPDRAKELYRQAIDAGNLYYSPRNLSKLLGDDETDYKKSLLRSSAEVGNVDALTDLGELLQQTDVEDAKHWFYQAIDKGERFRAPNLLGKLVSNEDKDEAVRLYEMAIASGNNTALFNMAFLITDEDPDRAIEFYEEHLSRANDSAAENNLALLLKNRDRERAIELFGDAIAQGDNYYAAKNLAELLISDDPEYAVKLAEKAFDAGNMDAVNVACDLREYLTYSFISKIPFDAKDIDNPILLNNLGVFWLGQKTEACVKNAIKLFERAVAFGDREFAGCNLAMVIAKNDPARAESLYRGALEYGQTEAMLGLGWLLEESDPEASKELLDQAYKQDDIIDSLKFISSYWKDIGDERYLELQKNIKVLEGKQEAAFSN